jgi:putative ABC transport system permease protein
MQLSAIGLIILLSSLTYTMMFYGLSGIEEPTKRFLDENNQEDFSVEMLNMVTVEESNYPLLGSVLSRGFYSLSDIKKLEPSTFYKLMDNRIKEFNEVYPGFSLELREYKNTQYDYKGRSHKALILKDAHKINLSYMEEGAKPAADDEIAVNKIYAQKNGINIGDPLVIKNRQYKVTGFVLFPDYTLPMFDETFNLDTGLQTLILMTDSEYERFDDKESFRLAGVDLTGKAIDTAYDKDKLPFVTQIATTKFNMRSGAIFDELTQGKVTALGLSIFIATIAVIIVSIMIYNLLQAERGQIGILKALGYRRREIAMPYFLSVLFFALVMLVAGYFLGTIYAEPLKELYLDFYLLPSVKIGQSFTVFATAIFVPFLFFAVVSGIIISRILGESALELLKPHENKSINKLSKSLSRMLAKAKGMTKFKYLHAIRSIGSFFIFFLGIMFSTILISFSFMMGGMVDRMTIDYLNKVDYQYESYADFTKRLPEVRTGDEKFLSYPFATLGDTTISLQGLSSRNRLYKLYDESGNDITVYTQNGAVITKRLSIKLGISEGDTISVTVNKAHYDFTVKGITDEYIADKVYLNIERLSNMLSENKSSRLFSGIYSIDKPSADYYSTILSKKGLIEQSKAMSNYTQFIVKVMIGGSAIIASSILFVLTSFTVEKNYYVISLLKVMGYKRREVNAMILNSYLVYAVISYLVSIPIALAILYSMMDLFASEYGVILPLKFEPNFIPKTLAILVVIYFASTYISRRKIARIPLQEVLKTYGE